MRTVSAQRGLRPVSPVQPNLESAPLRLPKPTMINHHHLHRPDLLRTVQR